MNKEKYTLATEIEKLIEKYQTGTGAINSDDFTHFKWELRNIITKYS